VALRFYIRDVIARTVTKWKHITRGADNYAEFLDRVDHWRRRTKPEQQVALVTFNYDVLLDEATCRLPYFSHPIVSTADYIDRDQYKLLKLNGSTNWLRLCHVTQFVMKDGPLSGWSSRRKFGRNRVPLTNLSHLSREARPGTRPGG